MFEEQDTDFAHSCIQLIHIDNYLLVFILHQLSFMMLVIVEGYPSSYYKFANCFLQDALVLHLPLTLEILKYSRAHLLDSYDGLHKYKDFKDPSITKFPLRDGFEPTKYIESLRFKLGLGVSTISLYTDLSFSRGQVRSKILDRPKMDLFL